MKQNYRSGLICLFAAVFFFNFIQTFFVNIGFVSVNKMFTDKKYNHTLFDQSMSAIRLSQDIFIDANQELIRLKGFLFLSVSKSDQAVETWSVFRPAPPVDFYVSWADKYVRDNNLEQATLWLGYALSEEPNHLEALYKLANVLLDQQRFDDSIQTSKIMLQIKHKQITTIGLSDIYFQLAKAQTRIPEQRELAIESSLSAMAINDFANERSQTDLLFFIGNLYGEVGQVDEGIYYLQRLLMQKPNHVWANIKLGELIYYGNKDAESALAYIYRSIELEDKNIRAFRMLTQISNDRDEIRWANCRILDLNNQDKLALELAEKNGFSCP